MHRRLPITRGIWWALLLSFLAVSTARPAAAGPKNWGEIYRQVYAATPEGREDIFGRLNPAAYKTDMETLGFSFESIDLLFAGARENKTFGVLNHYVDDITQLMTVFVMLSDLAAGKDVSKLGPEFLKDTTLWVGGSVIPRFIGKGAATLALKRAVWVTQAVDLILKAGNSLLVRPFFDTYERMWWGAYEH